MSRAQIGCDSCGSAVPARYELLDQRVCNACYSRLRRHPGVCQGCGQVKILAFHDQSRRIVCAACAGVRQRFGCRTCGSEDQLTGSQCGTCRLTDRLQELLADESGRIHPGLARLRDYLLSARDPRSATRWLRRDLIGTTLKAMATGEAPISHQTLNELPESTRVRYFRRMLMSAGTLPTIDVRLNDLEVYAVQFFADLVAEHASIITRYFNWEVLRKLRQRTKHTPLTTGAANTRRAELRKIAELLAWLDADGQPLSSLDQAAVDRFVAHHDQHRIAGAFIHWAARHRLSGRVTVPVEHAARAHLPIPEELLWIKIDRLVDDESIALPTRIIGLFILVFAQPLMNCVRLRRTDFVDDGLTIRMTFGITPTTLPKPIADLLRRHLATRHNRRVFQAAESEWLFEGVMPQHHVSEANVRLQLTALGIHTRTMKRARIDQLVQEVPASVVADVVGISVGTALHHAAQMNATWGAYPELRAPVLDE